MDYHSLVVLDIFRKFDALIDFAVRLQHLENGVLVDVLWIFNQEVVEIILQQLNSLICCLKAMLVFLAIKLSLVVVDFVEL